MCFDALCHHYVCMYVIFSAYILHFLCVYCTDKGVINMTTIRQNTVVQQQNACKTIEKNIKKILRMMTPVHNLAVAALIENE